MSAQEFLVRTRIQAASQALIETNAAIADIAIMHGFCDQSAFTRQFSRHVGETPRVFRQKRIRFGNEARTAQRPIFNKKCPDSPRRGEARSSFLE